MKLNVSHYFLMPMVNQTANVNCTVQCPYYLIHVLANDRAVKKNVSRSS